MFIEKEFDWYRDLHYNVIKHGKFSFFVFESVTDKKIKVCFAETEKLTKNAPRYSYLSNNIKSLIITSDFSEYSNDKFCHTSIESGKEICETFCRNEYVH